MPTVVLVGCLDTKGEEFAYARDCLRANGVKVLVVDTGVLGTPAFTADISRHEVAASAEEDLAELASSGTGAKAVEAMATGAKAMVTRLFDDGHLDGAMALGGTGGTSIGARAFRNLPIGVPKGIVSTAAVTGNAPTYIGQSDLILFPAVTDVAGLNRISAHVISNAAAAIAGMVKAEKPHLETARPAIAASMFGVTTPGVTAARTHLAELGYEVIVFHMTGVGGRTLERLVREDHFAGVLDVTTHELADELAGGVFAGDSDRATVAGTQGVPQVVSVGALDMVNFHTPDTVPAKYSRRQTLVHNPAVTIIRILPDEAAELGKRLARRLSTATGPSALYLPLRGISEYGVPGGPFHDPEADAAMYSAIRTHIDPQRVELVERDLAINDPLFTVEMADHLHHYIQRQTP